MMGLYFKHKWVPSRVGHGETQCENCGITNREALVIYDSIDGECAGPTSPSPTAEQYFKNLHEANVARNKQWDPGGQLTLSFRGNELAGEVGEACNVIKKLDREAMGLVGTRDTVEHLIEELADVVICAYLIGMHIGVDITPHIARKFNDTSHKRGLTVFMEE